MTQTIKGPARRSHNDSLSSIRWRRGPGRGGAFFDLLPLPMNPVVARASRPCEPKLTGETPVPLRLRPRTRARVQGFKARNRFRKILSSILRRGGEEENPCPQIFVEPARSPVIIIQ